MSYVECKIPSCGNQVFATEVCRKHYEEERLSKASPCSIQGCENRSYRGTLCAPHYRAERRSTLPKCIVPHCGQPQKTLDSQLCGRHYFRSKNHGSLAQPRPLDWGSRESHELYDNWHWHKRKGHKGMCQEWREDFWAFAKTVGNKLPGHSLRRLNPHLPLSPTNWEWKESFSNKDKAAYQREWRNRNPDKTKNNELKKRFGLTLADYEALVVKQEGLCAICKQPEYTKDKDGGPRSMPVDHCHVTGQIRGLLCTPCNRALGMFKDNVGNLQAAIDYIEGAKRIARAAS